MIGTQLVLGAIALVAAFVLVLKAFNHAPSRVEAGLGQISSFYERADLAADQRLAGHELPPVIERMRTFALRLSPSKRLGKLQHQLDIAGNPARWTLDRILAAKTVGLVVVAIFGIAVGLRQGAAVAVLFGAAGATAGFYLPDLLVYNTGLKRQEAIQKALPDSMDMLTICVEAGLAFDASLAQVARNTKGPLASEFARVLQEMQFGLSRGEALKAMSGRTTVPELRTLASALVQASQLGIPIAAVMREQSREMRVRRRQRAEERAQKVTVKILFPLVFCLLPALFIVVMGPGVISILHALSGM